MAIRINLLSEALAEEDLRRRDPVKRAIYGGALFVALSLVWWSYSWLQFVMDDNKLKSLEMQIQDQTNDFAQVKGSLKRIDDMQMRIDALNNLSTARFLQGNLLNALQQTYVPNVELTRFRVAQTYVLTPAVAAKSGARGRPASAAEHLDLIMDARDFSPNPGDQVQHFEETLLKQRFFAHLLGTNGIQLSALSPVQTPADGKPYVNFTLDCRFADRTP